MELREKYIQTLCYAVLDFGVKYTGDYGTGAECPFCHKSCRWDADSVIEIEHNPNCPVLIAKDLTTNIPKL